MAHPIENGRIVTNSLEYSAACHCNLRCDHCTHLSPFVRKTYPSLEGFKRDLDSLKEYLHTRVFRLLGGEPLLNPAINDFLACARKSGIADRVMVTTNGILLDRMNEDFWENADLVLVTLYPGISVRETIERAVPRARACDTELWVVSMPRFRATIVTERQPDDWITSAIFRTCADVHRFHCHMIHEGFLYRCPVPPFLPDYLSRLGEIPYDPRADGFPIHGSPDPLAELNEFLDSPVAPGACRWCLGSVGVQVDHAQLSPRQVARPAGRNVTREKYLDREKLLRRLLALETGEGTGGETGDPRPRRLA